jgi:hypothetical protein
MSFRRNRGTIPYRWLCCGEPTVRIFISWSGKRSKHIADALRSWLPNVIQAVVPFMSSHDIRKESRGNVVISENLEQAKVGVICLTPENLDARWILFEAGALSKLSSAYVCTYLLELSPSDVEPPLGQFQHTVATKDDTKALEGVSKLCCAS